MKEHSQPDQDMIYTQTLINFQHYIHDDAWTGDYFALDAELSGLLFCLLDAWSTDKPTKRTWGHAKFMNLNNVYFLHAFDERSQIELQIGLYEKGLYLETNITHPEHLLRMGDDFWRELLELHDYGQFEILENQLFFTEQVNQYPEILKPEVSPLVLLMRNIIAFPLLNDQPMDLGNLSITWPPDKYSFTEVRKLGTLAFARMIHLNRRLKKGK